MSFYQLLIHLLNFLAAPAAVALMLVALSRLLLRPNWPWVQSFAVQAALVFIATTGAMLLAWVIRGQDGTMGGHAAMVTAGAVCQWALLGCWRR